jgi:hypothetical protein
MNIGEGTRNYQCQHSDIFVADVEAAVDRFDAQLRFCARFGLGFPCLYFGEALPVDWTSIVPFAHEGLWEGLTRSQVTVDKSAWGKPATHPELSAWFHRLLGSTSLFNRFGGAMAYFDGARAISSFRKRLIEFLTVRFRARQSDISTGPGLQFQVVTQGYGLRVHWSPAYFFSPNNVFGSPTSPVDAWIQPGKYVFGAMGPDFPLQFDPATFDIPPLTQANLVGI